MYFVAWIVKAGISNKVSVSWKNKDCIGRGRMEIFVFIELTYFSAVE